MTDFHSMDLNPLLLKALDKLGHSQPTPIQTQAIPALLEGRDLFGIAQTGTGKTAAFALPTLNFLLENPGPRKPKSARVLVLTPTRELAAQVAQSFASYAKFMPCSVRAVFGGIKIGKQMRDLQRGCDVLVATPGRLLDLNRQGAVFLDDVDVLILDEADQMFDMGFINDLKTIIAATPQDRQTLLFSATMPKAIAQMAKSYLQNPVRVEVAPESTTAERVTQRVVHVAQPEKAKFLAHILSDEGVERCIVFTRTKHGADKVVRALEGVGIQSEAIHGNKSQSQRVKALNAFRAGHLSVLVATDIAARGIDVRGVSHVVNYELPNVPEQYVHRIGRTARAGADGVAISLVDRDEVYYLREIEKITAQSIELLDLPEELQTLMLPTPDRSARVAKPKGPGQRGRRNGPPRANSKPSAGAKRPGAPKRGASAGAGAKQTGEREDRAPRRAANDGNAARPPRRAAGAGAGSKQNGDRQDRAPRNAANDTNAPRPPKRNRLKAGPKPTGEKARSGKRPNGQNRRNKPGGRPAKAHSARS